MSCTLCTVLQNIEFFQPIITSYHLLMDHVLHLMCQVWKALLENMPMTAMIRNLGKMTAIGLIDEVSDHSEKVCSALQDPKKLSDAKIHPFNVLIALRQYEAGHGDKGKLSWQPNPLVVSALDEAFYLAFKVQHLN